MITKLLEKTNLYNHRTSNSVCLRSSSEVKNQKEKYKLRYIVNDFGVRIKHSSRGNSDFIIRQTIKIYINWHFKMHTIM